MRPLLLALALLLSAPVAAQSVEDRYHAAARLYVDGDNRTAEATAEEALRLDPDHRRLQALLEKIRERNPQDSGGSGAQSDPEAEQPQEGGEQPRRDDQAGGEQQQPEGDSAAPDEQPGEEGDPSDADTEPPPETEDPQQGREGDIGPEGDAEGATGQQGGDTPAPSAEGGMTPTQAEQLLRAIEADEQNLIREVQRRRTPRRSTEKDW